MDRQRARKRAASFAVGRVFKASEGAAAAATWRTRQQRPEALLEPVQEGSDCGGVQEAPVGRDQGRFPPLLLASCRWTPSCAACGAGLSWPSWWEGQAALPGRGGGGPQRYSLCGGCRARDASFKDVFG